MAENICIKEGGSSLLEGNATPSDVANGKTFYNNDPSEIRTGTHIPAITKMEVAEPFNYYSSVYRGGMRLVTATANVTRSNDKNWCEGELIRAKWASEWTAQVQVKQVCNIYRTDTHTHYLNVPVGTTYTISMSNNSANWDTIAYLLE